jgi:hypothetical protein
MMSEVKEEITKLKNEIKNLQDQVQKLQWMGLRQFLTLLPLITICGFEDTNEPLKVLLQNDGKREMRKKKLAGFTEVYEIGIDDFFNVLEAAFPDAVKLADIIPFKHKDE